jgi:hypothetical protein
MSCVFLSLSFFAVNSAARDSTEDTEPLCVALGLVVS